MDHKQLREDVQKVLNLARKLLEEGGWVRNHEHLGGSHCLVGAINLASFQVYSQGAWYRRDQVSNHELSMQAQSAVEKTLARVKHWRSSIPSWNDGCAKDVDEVLEVLKLAEEEAAVA